MEYRYQPNMHRSRKAIYPSEVKVEKLSQMNIARKKIQLDALFKKAIIERKKIKKNKTKRVLKNLKSLKLRGEKLDN